MNHVWRWIFDMIMWDWAHVGIFKIDRQGSVLIHCFESRTGRRKVRLKTTFNSISAYRKAQVRRSMLYQTRVYPWLKGTPDPDIPTYKDIFCKKEEFVNSLKGKKLPRIINDEDYQ